VIRNTLFGIYGVGSKDPATCELTHLFGDEGYVDSETISRAYLEQEGRAMEQMGAGRAGPFARLEDLQRYAYALCDQIGVARVILIDRDEYNQKVEHATSLDELREILPTMGSAMENADHSKGGTIWSKIFN
jgi:hypothetical protein